MNSIGSGGAERALGRILQGAGDRHERYQLHLALLDREPEMRDLPALEDRYCLDAGGSLILSAIRLRRLVRDLRPTLVVSLLVRANLATALAVPGSGANVVLCERMHLSSHLRARHGPMTVAVLRALARRAYPRADRVLAVSEGVRRDLLRWLALRAESVLTINNPYDIEHIVVESRTKPAVALPPAFIVAVGRLVAAKGFTLLIEAYRRADPPLPLLILGEGPDRARFERQIAASGLDNRVKLLGFLRSPFAVMARASFLVSASHNEGFPNAIAEAMALRLPVAATDCPSGPAELLGAEAAGAGEVVEAPYGLIVRNGDCDALAEAIRRMADPALRGRLARAARVRIDDFRSERIAADYWAVFDALAS